MTRTANFLIVLTAWLMASPTVAADAPAAGPLRALMEKSSLPDGWTRTDKVEFFDKDTLFDLIDGEAEAFFPYGFVGAVSARYFKNGDKAREAVVEVFEMGSPLDAFGIFSIMREPDSPPVAVGAEGVGGSTQILFYAGKYFVKAQVFSEEAAGDLSGLAKAVADLLPGGAKPPAQRALVAVPGLVPRSEQYIAQSVLGYACWPKGMTGRVKIGEKTTARVFVVVAGSHAAAQDALDKYAREVSAAGADIKKIDDEGNAVLVLRDSMHGGMAVAPAGKFVLGAANLDQPEKQGPPLVRALRRQAETKE